jgi:SAM-dependent methyltransferase
MGALTGATVLDPTKRFSTRVDNYVKYRPHYPREVIDILREKCGLSPAWRIADVGSGTGILTELFLNNGNPVYAVEPNGPMRAAAEQLLGGDANFTSVDGTAEKTTLGDASVDMVTAGQAFHWFDQGLAKQEFRRILKPGGWVVLVWNDRRLDATPFMTAYGQLLLEYTTDFTRVDHRQIDAVVLSEFFAPGGFEACTCDNRQVFDFEGLSGRLLSSSYAPEPGDPRHEPMMAELSRIFELYQSGGQVVFEYDTQVYLGQLGR